MQIGDFIDRHNSVSDPSPANLHFILGAVKHRNGAMMQTLAVALRAAQGRPCVGILLIDADRFVCQRLDDHRICLRISCKGACIQAVRKWTDRRRLRDSPPAAAEMLDDR
jgi:hypothetical protein